MNRLYRHAGVKNSAPKRVAPGIATDFESLINDKETSDVILYVKDENGIRHDFYCHKIVLGTRNKHFENLFFNENNQDKEILVQSVTDPKVFLVFLKYLYTNVLFDVEENKSQILALADEYDAVHLKVQCGQYDKSKLTDENWVEMLRFALKNHEDEFADDCLSYAGENIERYITDGTALKFERDMILLLLDRDDLSIDELSLFEFVKRWVSTNQVTDYADLFKKIRIALLDVKTLKTIIKPSGFISDDDYIEALEYCAIQDDSTERKFNFRSSTTNFEWVNNHANDTLKNYTFLNGSKTVRKESTTTWDLIVHSSIEINRGISYWQIKIDSINNDRSGTVIGVVNNRKHLPGNYSGAYGLGMTGTGYNAGECYSAFNKGDVLGIVVDFVKDVIIFYKNGKKISTAFSKPSALKRLWAVVFLYYPTDQVSLCNEYPLNSLKN